MESLETSLAALRRAALIRVADKHGFRYTQQDLNETLNKGRTLSRSLDGLARKQSADIVISYNVNKAVRIARKGLVSALKYRVARNRKS